MWSDWKQKIREFADDITSPQFEEEEEEDAVHGEDVNPIRLPRSAAPAVTADTQPTHTHDDDDGDAVRRLEYTVERARPVPSPPRSTAAQDTPAAPSPSTSDAPHTASERAAPTTLARVPPVATTQSASFATDPTRSSATPSSAAAAQGPPVSPAVPTHSEADTRYIASLQSRIEALEQEKEDMNARVAAYQENVRLSHEEMVAYYEARQSQSEAELRAAAEEEKRVLLDECEEYKRRLAEAEEASVTCAQRARDLERALADKEALLEALRTAASTTVAEAPSVATTSPPIADEAHLQGLKDENSRLRDELVSLQKRYEQQQDQRTQQSATDRVDQNGASEAHLRTLEAQLTSERTRASQLEEQCANQSQAHTAEMKALTQQMQAALSDCQEKLSVAEAQVAQLETDLAETRERVRATAVRTEDARAAPVHAAEMAALTEQLESMRQQAVEADRIQHTLRDEIGTLQNTSAQNMELQKLSLTKEWEARLTLATSEKQSLQTRLDASQRELQLLSRAREEERTHLSAAGDASLAELREMNRKLEAIVQNDAALLQQLEATVEDVLKRAEVSLPSRGGGRGGHYTFSDLIAVLTSEFDRLVKEEEKAEQILHEWEDTYEKAKDVNESLNEQLSEAWRRAGEAQEGLSTAQRERDDLHQQVEELEAHLDECEHALMEERRQRQELSDEKAGWVHRLSESETDVAGQQERLQSLEQEVAASHALLAEREEELVVARRSVDNLQLALESFKHNRARDVEERTVDLQAEIEELRARLAQAERAGSLSTTGGGTTGTGTGADGRQRGQLIRELAEKNLEVTHLHSKLQELRRMLEDTARQLSGETMIDKGVASHLMVNYIHAFVAQRKEADEMLKVMSGLLGWDDEMQERAGLLPGPLNPHPPESKGRRGFLSFGRRGPANAGASATPGKSGVATDGARGGDGSATASKAKRPSLAALWVDFLMKESATSAPKSTSSVPGNTPRTDALPVSTSPSQTAPTASRSHDEAESATPTSAA